MTEPESICDYCSLEIDITETNSCENDCGGTFCEEHAPPEEHDCDEIEEDKNEAD